MNSLNLLKQYADTGAILSEYQLEKLSPNLRNSYIRRRMLQARESTRYELQYHEEKYAPEEEQERLRTERFQEGKLFPEEYLAMDEEDRQYYITKIEGGLSLKAFTESSDKCKELYAVTRMRRGTFTETMFKYLPQDKIPEFLEYKAAFTLKLEIYHLLSDEQKVFFLTHQSMKKKHVNDVLMMPQHTKPHLLDKAWATKIKCNYLLHSKELERANADVQIEHIKLLLDNNEGLQKHDYLSLEMKARKFYKDMGGYIFN